MIKLYNLDPEVRGRINDVPRRQIHVCTPTFKNLDYLYRNVPRGQLFHTINGALSGQKEFDDIIVWPGAYNEVGASQITKDGVRLRAAISGPGMGMSFATRLWQDDSTVGNVGVIDVQGAQGVEICGFKIGPYTGATGVGINVGTTSACWGTWIHDCLFHTAEAENMCSYISLGTTTTSGSESTLISDNYFHAGGANTGAAAQILWNHSIRSEIRNNTFIQIGGSTNYIGIKVGSTLVNEQGSILNNRFFSKESGSTLGISLTSTATGHLWIDGNHFVGYTANANCFTYNADNAGLNYLGVTAISS